MSQFRGGFFNIVSNYPMIIIRSGGPGQMLDRSLPDRPVCHWVYYAMHQTPERVIEHDAEIKRMRPHDRVIHMPEDLETCEAEYPEGVEVSSLSLHCLIPDREFPPTPRHHIKYDAVIVSRSVPWKRHELGAEVASLGILATAGGKEEKAYLEELKGLMPHARFFNPDGKVVDRAEVARIMGTGAVGLCLSESEGGCRASQECQLVGRPVVSTHSHGGRDRFFDAASSLIVEPDPTLIAEAVQEMVARQLDQKLVRKLIMQRFVEHRCGLIALGQEWWFDQGRMDDFAPMFYQSMGELRWHPNQKIVDKILATH